MVRAKQGNTVRVHYTGKLEDGTVFDTSIGHDPMQFTIGQRQLLPGFEQSVIGMEPGEGKTVKIPAHQAYGLHETGKVIEVDRDRIPSGFPLKIGLRLQGSPAGGRAVDFTIIGLTDTKVTLDGNHPLAGKDLTFDIELLEVA